MMRFRSYKMYAHVSMLDVCFMVRKSWSNGRKHKLKITWFLKKGLRSMGFTDNIEICSSQYKNYREIRNAL